LSEEFDAALPAQPVFDQLAKGPDGTFVAKWHADLQVDLNPGNGVRPADDGDRNARADDPMVRRAYGQRVTARVKISPPANVRTTLQRWDGNAWRI
jgi:hypothetical protein